MATKIRLRRGLASEWASNNPILGLGEVGLEVDTKNFKVGDGLSAWLSLEYYIASTDNYYLKTEIDSLLANKVDKITPITSGTYRRPVFTVNEQGQITSIREKLVDFIDSVSNIANSTTTFLTYLTLDFEASEIADYKIDFVAIYFMASTTVSPVIDVLLDGVGIYSPEVASREEPSDSNTVERSIRSGFVVKNVSSGSHSLQLVFAPEGNSTLTMRYGALRISEE